MRAWSMGFRGDASQRTFSSRADCGASVRSSASRLRGCVHERTCRALAAVRAHPRRGPDADVPRGRLRGALAALSALCTCGSGKKRSVYTPKTPSQQGDTYWCIPKTPTGHYTPKNQISRESSRQARAETPLAWGFREQEHQLPACSPEAPPGGSESPPGGALTVPLGGGPDSPPPGGL